MQIKSIYLALAIVLAACSSESHQALPEWCSNLPREAYKSLERIPVSSDWFEVYTVAPDVLAIYEPFQFQEVISYLILGKDRALLFDTGMGIASIRDVVSELSDLPVEVFNSHTHFDHIGGNHEFGRVTAMDTEFTRANSRGSSHEEVAGQVSPAALCKELPQGMAATGYRIHPYHIDRYVADGHRFDIGGRVLEVLSIPGHTEDAVALFEAQSGYLWTGDSFYAGPIYLFSPGTDLAHYRSSVHRLAELVPQLTKVFPGHNTPIEQPKLLTELKTAFEQVIKGEAIGEPRGRDRVEYAFGRFSLLMQRQN